MTTAPIGGVLERVEAALAELSPTALEVIEPLLPAWVRRARRLAARDRAVRALGESYIGGLGSSRAAAAALRRDLLRYCCSGQRRRDTAISAHRAERHQVRRIQL
jgi:hypothetical protein